MNVPLLSFPLFYTPSPHVTRFRVARNSAFVRVMRGIPRYAEFQRNSTTVPLTRFSRNAEFRKCALCTDQVYSDLYTVLQLGRPEPYPILTFLIVAERIRTFGFHSRPQTSYYIFVFNLAIALHYNWSNYTFMCRNTNQILLTLILMMGHITQSICNHYSSLLGLPDIVLGSGT